MARKKNPIPSYQLHKGSKGKGSKLAYVRVYIGGKRVTIYLGTYGSEASRTTYQRVLRALDDGTDPRDVPGVQSRKKTAKKVPTTTENSMAIRTLCGLFLAHAERKYPQENKRSNTLRNYIVAIHGLLHLCGDLPVDEFRPRDLKRVREALLKGTIPTPKGRKGKPLALASVNHRVGCIKAVISWGVSEEHVPSAVAEALRHVESLAPGHSGVKPTKPTQPVPIRDVVATARHASDTVAAMIRLQLRTGMRPGELCGLRLEELDTSQDVWRYTPAAHKNTWRGQDRVVYIGPRAQRILRPFVDRATLRGDGRPLFNPRDADLDRKRILREQRRSHPSANKARDQRRAEEPRREFQDRYTPTAFRKAVQRAAKRAGVKPWAPKRARNTFASLWAPSNPEAARVALGHRTDAMTRRYADGGMKNAAAELLRRHG